MHQTFQVEPGHEFYNLIRRSRLLLKHTIYFDLKIDAAQSQTTLYRWFYEEYEYEAMNHIMKLQYTLQTIFLKVTDRPY